MNVSWDHPTFRPRSRRPGSLADHAAVKTEFLKVMIDYKAAAEREIERRAKLGIKDISDIDPHPDDILIDLATGGVYVKGELNPKDSQMLRKLGLKRSHDC
jgi:hypothetical protein